YEHIGVIQGTGILGTADRFSRSDLQEMPVGTYALVPKKMNHFAMSQGHTIIQVHGIGPFRMNFVDQNIKVLSNPSDASFFKFKMGDRVRGPKGVGVIKMGGHSPLEKGAQYTVQTGPDQAYAAPESDLELAP